MLYIYSYLCEYVYVQSVQGALYYFIQLMYTENM